MSHENHQITAITDTPAALAGDNVERLARLVGLISAVLLLAFASGIA